MFKIMVKLLVSYIKEYAYSFLGSKDKYICNKDTILNVFDYECFYIRIIVSNLINQTHSSILVILIGSSIN